VDIITHLTKEHREVEGLLNSLAESEPGAGRNRLIEELDRSLSVHMLVEEQFVYPIVERVIDKESETEAEVEHSLARDGLTKLHELADEPGFGAAVDMLKAGIAHHVKEEEEELFPELRQRAAADVEELDPERLETQVRADGQTRDELYEQARAADIDGRSNMTKDQLAQAVQRQQA
jgi:iron-sulfur cluster repair protein YtfE (RIC family)